MRNLTTSDVAQITSEDKYLRERLTPKPGDYYYLYLSDLRLALEEFKTTENIKILDYGCGGSPYKSLFPNSVYLRADIVKTEGLDYMLDENSNVDEQNASFDLILSTQVAEHVKSPHNYFSEAHRLLKNNGIFVCSTHGCFHDHGLPYDYQRWTAEGLKRDLENGGFWVEKVVKITTGARAFFTVLEWSLYTNFAFPRSTPFGMFVRTICRFAQSRKTYIHKQLDKHTLKERIVLDQNSQSEFYVGLLAVGRKMQS